MSAPEGWSFTVAQRRDCACKVATAAAALRELLAVIPRDARAGVVPVVEAIAAESVIDAESLAMVVRMIELNLRRVRNRQGLALVLHLVPRIATSAAGGRVGDAR